MAKKDEPAKENETKVEESAAEVPQESQEELKAQQETKQENPLEETPDVAEEKTEEPTEDQTEEKEVPEAEEEKPPSRREQLRVQDLLKKYGPPQPQAPSSTTKPDFDWVEADETTRKGLEDTAQQFGKELYNQGLEQIKYANWETLLNVDDSQVRSKYEILNPDNKETYHPAIANAMYAKYARTVGYDPGDPEKGIPKTVRHPEVRFSDFVEAELEFADELASQRVAKTTENIAKQAASTGLRPDGSFAKLNLNKAPEQMTDDELSAVIAQSIK